MFTRLGQRTGIDSMIAAPPPEFKRMCQNFGPDLAEFVSSWEDLVQHALIGIDQAEARAIRNFLDQLLSAGLSDHDLKTFWWTMPVTAVFETGDQVRTLLTRIRETISKPPYT